jgi:hypothetical protein
VRALPDEQIAAMRDPRLVGTVRLPRTEDAVKAGDFLAGRPEDIIEELKAVEKRYPGLDRRIAGVEQDWEQSISWDQFSVELRQWRRACRQLSSAPLHGLS